MNYLNIKSVPALMLAILVAATSPLAQAVPEGINYQAYLTHSDGTAVDTTSILAAYRCGVRRRAS